MKVSKGPKRVGIYSSFYNNSEYDSVIKAATEAALQGLQGESLVQTNYLQEQLKLKIQDKINELKLLIKDSVDENIKQMRRSKWQREATGYSMFAQQQRGLQYQLINNKASLSQAYKILNEIQAIIRGTPIKYAIYMKTDNGEYRRLEVSEDEFLKYATVQVSKEGDARLGSIQHNMKLLYDEWEKALQLNKKELQYQRSLGEHINDFLEHALFREGGTKYPAYGMEVFEAHYQYINHNKRAADGTGIFDTITFNRNLQQMYFARKKDQTPWTLTGDIGNTSVKYADLTVKDKFAGQGIQDEHSMLNLGITSSHTANYLFNQLDYLIDTQNSPVENAALVKNLLLLCTPVVEDCAAAAARGGDKKVIEKAVDTLVKNLTH